jgi:hypothetical protein
VDLRWLRLASWAESVSLLVLLVNLGTAHVAAVASLMGPVHGCAYLATIATAFLLPLPPAARRRTLVPGIGGLLALRRATALPRATCADPAPLD